MLTCLTLKYESLMAKMLNYDTPGCLRIHLGESLYSDIQSLGRKTDHSTSEVVVAPAICIADQVGGMGWG